MSMATKAQHEKWMKRLATTFHNHAEAMWHIINDKTYEAQEYKSFGDFCDAELPFSRQYAYQVASCHDTILKLPISVSRYLTNESQFRPLKGMKPENQIKVIKIAAKVAKGKKLTGKIIEQVAEKNFKWLSKAKYRAQKKGKGAEQDQTIPNLEAAFELINAQTLTPAEMVKKYGNPFEWKGFADALKVLQDLSDSAP